jgi:hypothetical protein
MRLLGWLWKIQLKMIGGLVGIEGRNADMKKYFYEPMKERENMVDEL